MIDEVLIMAKKNKSRGRYLLKQLSQQYKIYRIDMGDDAHLSRKGFVFDTRTYKIKGVGHLCVMNMKAMFGLMRMETVILEGAVISLTGIAWCLAFYILNPDDRIFDGGADDE